MQLAELFVLIRGNAAPLNATLGGVQASLNGLVASAGGLGPKMLAALGFASVGAAISYGLHKAFMSASDLNEAMDSARSTFGEAFDVVNAQADAMNKRFGLSRKELIQMADAFGAIAQGAGMSDAASAKFANTFDKLAADLSSKKNLSLEDAGRALQSGLRGEMEPLSRFGVVINENAVKAYAYAHGLAKAGQELDTNTKFAARAALIQQQLAKVTGDLERTEGSAANQTRKMWGQIETLTEKVGAALMPAFQAMLSLANEVFGDLINWLDRNSASFEGYVSTVVSWVETAGVVYRNWGDIVQIVGVTAAEYMAYVGIAVAHVGESFRVMGQYVLDNIVGLGQVLWEAFRSPLENITTAISAVGRALAKVLRGETLSTDDFLAFLPQRVQDAFAALPPLQLPGMDLSGLDAYEDQVRELFNNIAGREAGRKAGAKPGATPAAEAAAAGGVAGATGRAKTEDLAAFAKGIQEGIFNAKDKATKAAEKTASNTDDMLKALRQMADAAARGAGAAALPAVAM